MNNQTTIATSFLSSHFLLERLFSVLEEGIAILNKEGIVEYINTAGQQMFESSMVRFPVPGNTYLEFVDPLRRQRTARYMEKAFLGKPTVLELEYPQHNKPAWFQLGYYPIPEETGEVNYICVKAREITDQRRIKVSLQRQRKKEKIKIRKAEKEAQMKERSEIGRELHDNINQVLTTVKLYNELCLSEEVTNKPILLKSVQNLSYCIDEIRKLSHRLSNPTGAAIHLSQQLQTLSDSVAATRRLHVEYLSYNTQGKVLTPEAEVVLFRIAQELITNVLKHSEATQLELMLVGVASSLALRVRDNGKGFDASEAASGMGLASVRQKVASIGGTLEVDTAPGQGCNITIEVPC